MNLELSAEIRFRCPNCQKLFCTENNVFTSSNQLEEVNANPIFECTDCKKEFYLTHNQNSAGLYMTEAVSEKKFSVCPKCSHLKPIGVDECPSCGVLESKFVEMQKVENPRLYELNKLWTQVIQNFDADQFHQQFLNKAQEQSALSFASQKYKDVKAILGHDDLVEKYLRQIDTRLEMQVLNKFNSQSQFGSQINGGVGSTSFIDNENKNVNRHKSQDKIISGSSSMTSANKVATAGFDLKTLQETFDKRDAFFIIAVLGTVILILNKAMKLFPNLNGLVVAITVLAYGLWFVSRENK